jgi:hypothetical protein
MYHECERGANEMIYVDGNNIGKRRQQPKDAHKTKHFIPSAACPRVSLRIGAKLDSLQRQT